MDDVTTQTDDDGTQHGDWTMRGGADILPSDGSSTQGEQRNEDYRQVQYDLSHETSLPGQQDEPGGGWY